MSEKWTVEDVFPPLALDRKLDVNFPIGVPHELSLHIYRKKKTYTLYVTNTGKECVILNISYRIFTLVSSSPSHSVLTKVPLLVGRDMRYPPQYVSDGNIAGHVPEGNVSAIVDQLFRLPRPVDLHAFFLSKHAFGTFRLASHTHVRQYIAEFLKRFNAMPRLPKRVIVKPPPAAKESGYSYAIFPRTSCPVMQGGVVRHHGMSFHLHLAQAVPKDALFTNLPVTTHIPGGMVFRAQNCAFERIQHDAFCKAFREARRQGALPLDIHAFYLNSETYREHQYDALPSHNVFRRWIDELEKDEEDVVEVDQETALVPSNDAASYQPHPLQEPWVPPPEQSFLPPPEQPPPPACAIREKLHIYCTKAAYGENVTRTSFARLCAVNEHAARFGMRVHGKVSCVEDVVHHMGGLRYEALPYLVFVEMSPTQMHHLPAAYDRIDDLRRAVEKDLDLERIYEDKYASDKDTYGPLYIAFLQQSSRRKIEYATALSEFSLMPKEVQLFFAVWRGTTDDTRDIIVESFS